MRKKISKLGFVLVLLLVMVGCTTPSQWIADAQVDELCAKDGGIKVYETVTLPKERFNQWGQFKDISIGENTKPTEEYYSTSENKYIQANDSGKFGGLSVFQYHFFVYQRKDYKLLGESISYIRRGGDILAVDMPSAYYCYEHAPDDLLKQIFLKSN